MIDCIHLIYKVVFMFFLKNFALTTEFLFKLVFFLAHTQTLGNEQLYSWMLFLLIWRVRDCIHPCVIPHKLIEQFLILWILIKYALRVIIAMLIYPWSLSSKVSVKVGTLSYLEFVFCFLHKFIIYTFYYNLIKSNDRSIYLNSDNKFKCDDIY